MVTDLQPLMVQDVLFCTLYIRTCSFDLRYVHIVWLRVHVYCECLNKRGEKEGVRE